MKQLQRCLTEVGALEGVFKKMPPQGAQELKTLQKHEILEIEFAVKSAAARKKSLEAKRTLEMQSAKKRQEADEMQRRSFERYCQQLDFTNSTERVKAPANLKTN